MGRKQKILVIVGPTASGKSALAVHLARKFKGEIISADSRQVYKGLNIGTGKISEREMNGIPHHLLDVASPKKSFSAHDFTKAARAACSRILQKTKIPIVVGGTGFYIDSLVGRIVLPDVPPNTKLRAHLEKKSVAQLFALLKRRDPKRAAMLSTPSERNNKVRLVRALEIAITHNRVPHMNDLRNRSFDTMWIGVRPSDTALRRNITKRLHARMKEGMVREAKKLHATGLSYKRMEQLGLEYRSLARFLQKKVSEEEMVRELNSDIWRYARKQIGYWKRNKDIKWFRPTEKAEVEKAVRQWLTK